MVTDLYWAQATQHRFGGASMRYSLVLPQKQAFDPNSPLLLCLQPCQWFVYAGSQACVASSHGTEGDQRFPELTVLTVTLACSVSGNYPLPSMHTEKKKHPMLSHKPGWKMLWEASFQEENKNPGEIPHCRGKTRSPFLLFYLDQESVAYICIVLRKKWKKAEVTSLKTKAGT